MPLAGSNQIVAGEEVNNMLKSLLRLAAVASFAAAAVVPVTASASGGGFPGTGITVTIGSPISLQDRILVDVPVTITCTQPLTNGFGFAQVTASVQQAGGRNVATGSGFLSLDQCPSSPTTYVLQVLTQPSSQNTAPIPFHGGPAIASAGAFACDAFFTTCIGGSTPLESVRL